MRRKVANLGDNQKALELNRLLNLFASRLEVSRKSELLGFLQLVSEQSDLDDPPVFQSMSIPRPSLPVNKHSVTAPEESYMSNNTVRPASSFDNFSQSLSNALSSEKNNTSQSMVPNLDQDHISEPLLLRDIIFVMQGISGSYLKYDTERASFDLDDKVSVPYSWRKITEKICKIGLLCVDVQNYIKENVDTYGGLVQQSLCSALQKELSEYYKLVAVLEAQLPKSSQDASDNNSAKGLTLQRLYMWTRQPYLRLQLMWMLIKSCKGFVGGELVSRIFSFGDHGDPFVQQFINQILDSVSRPFFHMLHRWIYEGELEDPYGEFFVAESDFTEQDLWQKKYTMRANMIPEFINNGLANKIFSIGKSLNFIRHSCHEEILLNSQTEASTTEDLKYSDMALIESRIDQTYDLINTKILEVLFDKFKLETQLLALKRYVFLYQGDFAHYLMESIMPELSKPIASIYAHNLSSILEGAIRGSNAQYEDPDILHRLIAEVSKDDGESEGDGWNSFNLTYYVDSPVSTILTKQALEQYSKIFKFLWSLKRVEYTLNAGWRRQITATHTHRKKSEIRTEFQQSYLVCEEMLHFIYQFQCYVQFEVLECSWDELQQFVQKKSGDLDSLINAHYAYLNRIMNRLFLESSQSAMLRLLNQIFETMLQFRLVQDKLYRYTQTTLDPGRSTLNLSDDDSDLALEDEELLPIRAELFEVSHIFKEQISSLIENLSNRHDEYLKSLRLRLDFNEFYYKDMVKPY
ncbi:hypothetical protein K493DRAFT_333842 [Basidiobolus meristosporus CBS 931.73]|uniref:Uncharacterized protein n=1 Tax=Basidiobolus meristosporus CBS 931.73 TaxID=1314790 RepID=A0A1Y1Z303_9FUNG|nr:hypothetical protein K493DRAFT_333842 [Basidiobolus meristosporus CBS 931.73]|eukprot:ORY04589.1 hypothetical protein K493DRAFT_333842 [Basidiobolus meristosporus CBS 931.73]